jgi:hypothetical protein
MRSTVRKTRNEFPRLPAGRRESQIGLYGGADPLQNGKMDTALWEEPVAEAPASLARMNERWTNRKNE